MKDNVKDLPDDVQAKIRRFREQEGLIRSLETQLEKVRHDQAQLQAELMPYLLKESRPDPGHPYSQTCIGRCPPEVLHEIFQYSLHHAHMEIINLLLVCKTWQGLVMNSPRLWARIETPRLGGWEDNPFLFDTKFASYVSTCLKHSRDLSLDIILDLSNVPTTNGYVTTLLLDVAKKTVHNLGGRTPFHILSTTNWCPGIPMFGYQFLNILQESIHRWRHLTIWVPSASDRCEPMLKQLNLQDAELSSLELHTRDNSLDTSLSRNILPGISGVKSLTCGYLSFSSFRGSPTLLQHLAINPRNISDLEPLALCTNLLSLELGMQHCRPNFKATQLSLHLPKLQSLTTDYYIEPLAHVTFECPVLEYLEMRRPNRASSYAPDFKGEIPDLLGLISRRVHMIVDWDEGCWSFPSVESIHRLLDGNGLFTFSAEKSNFTINGEIWPPKKSITLALQPYSRAEDPEELCGLVMWFEKWAEDNLYTFKCKTLI